MAPPKQEQKVKKYGLKKVSNKKNRGEIIKSIKIILFCTPPHATKQDDPDIILCVCFSMYPYFLLPLLLKKILLRSIWFSTC